MIMGCFWSLYVLDEPFYSWAGGQQKHVAHPTYVSSTLIFNKLYKFYINQLFDNN